MDIYFPLNTKQREAVKADGSIIINAGPGTGKTKALVARIIYLITQKNIHPSHILALTFTKKAAEEMKNRLKRDNIRPLPYIATFHALAYGILQDVYVKIDVVEKQENKKANVHNQFTYDELIQKTRELLNAKEPKINKWRSRFSHILIDEFQDTNVMQFEIVKNLLHTENLYVIGDPYQSIYGFRGADPSIFQIICVDFQNVSEITLTQNYRSGQNIIDVSHNLFPSSKRLLSMIDSQGAVQYIITQNEKTESRWILKDIQNHIGGADLLQASDNRSNDQNYRFSDFAVIFRTHHIGRILEGYFCKESIPYQMIGGDSLFERPHIYAITSAMKTLLKEGDTKAKVSNIIRMIVENKTIETMIKHSEQKQTDVQHFVSMMCQFDRYEDGLFQAIQHITYLEEHEYYDYQADKVTLLTMHAAKGLEFAHVYIAGFEEGMIPLIRGDIDSEEEKRLLYVAMTRAKKTLSLIRPKYRFGKNTQETRFCRMLAKNPAFQKKIDKEIVAGEKRRKKWFDKKSQMKMF